MLADSSPPDGRVGLTLWDTRAGPDQLKPPTAAYQLNGALITRQAAKRLATTLFNPHSTVSEAGLLFTNKDWKLTN